jgi:hypothetical protein
MAKLMEGRKTTVRNLVLMLAGSLALGYLAITVIGNPIVAAQVGRRIPADTPVVLLGGSVKLEEHSFPVQNWQPGPLPTRYYYAPAGKSIATIALCFDSGNKRLNYSHSVCSADGISSPGTDTFTDS